MPWSARIAGVALVALLVGLVAWNLQTVRRNNQLLADLAAAEFTIEVRTREVERLQREIISQVERTETTLLREVTELQREVARLETVADRLRRQIRDMGGTPRNGGEPAEGEERPGGQGPRGPRGPRGDPGPDPPDPGPDCGLRVLFVCLFPDTALRSHTPDVDPLGKVEP